LLLQEIEVNLSEFEQRVLQATLLIPYGETRTYAQIAKAVGKPKAARAVGQALKKNPLPIVVPCHRVVKSDGGVGGYAGGVKLKKILIDGERRSR
jgi:methylated-DNA-[protein]-cysteine S-methyltransferase